MKLWPCACARTTTTTTKYWRRTKYASWANETAVTGRWVFFQIFLHIRLICCLEKVPIWLLITLCYTTHIHSCIDVWRPISAAAAACSQTVRNRTLFLLLFLRMEYNLCKHRFTAQYSTRARSHTHTHTAIFKMFIWPVWRYRFRLVNIYQLFVRTTWRDHMFFAVFCLLCISRAQLDLHNHFLFCIFVIFIYERTNSCVW